MHTDVIVVGGRAAGAATGLLLARAGLRVSVIERSQRGADTLSTHALLRGAVMQLARWGLLGQLIAAGTPPIRRAVFSYPGEQVTVAIKPGDGFSALYAPRRTVLDPIIADAAADAGAVLQYGTTVTGLATSAGRVVGVHTRDAAGEHSTLTARLVVGADGVHSAVARLAGAPVTHQGRHGAAATYAYWPEGPADAYHWVFQRDACVGAIPTNGGTCVFASATPATIGRGGVDVIRRLAATQPELAARLTDGTPTGARTWPGLPGYLRRPYGPGWALVGDAGYFKDPISSHGLTDALRDAELLAGAVIAGWGDEASLAESLADYGATRDRLSLALFRTVDRIAAHDWNAPEIAGLLRDMSAATTAEVDHLAALDTCTAAVRAGS